MMHIHLYIISLDHLPNLLDNQHAVQHVVSLRKYCTNLYGICMTPQISITTAYSRHTSLTTDTSGKIYANSTSNTQILLQIRQIKPASIPQQIATIPHPSVNNATYFSHINTPVSPSTNETYLSIIINNTDPDDGHCYTPSLSHTISATKNHHKQVMFQNEDADQLPPQDTTPHPPSLHTSNTTNSPTLLPVPIPRLSLTSNSAIINSATNTPCQELFDQIGIPYMPLSINAILSINIARFLLIHNDGTNS